MNRKKLRACLLSSTTILGLLTSLSSQASAQSFAQQSCSRFGNPLDNASLISRKERAGDWTYRRSNERRSLTDSFERYVIDKAWSRARFNTQSFPSPQRAQRTNNELQNVVPDGVGDNFFRYTYNFNYFGETIPIPWGVSILNSIFYESKTGVTKLSGSSGSGSSSVGASYQMLGFLDALDLEFRTNTPMYRIGEILVVKAERADV